MLGAIVWLVLLAAAAFAVTQVGGLITLVFIAAVLFLAYRRLSLLTFTVTFTVLLAAYTWFGASGAPAGVWKGFLWLLLAGLWLLNVLPAAQGGDHPPVHEGVPAPVARACHRPRRRHSRPARCGGTGSCSPADPHWQKLLAAKPPQLTAEEQAFLDGPCSAAVRGCSMTGTSRTRRGDLPPAVWEFLKTRGFFAMIIPKRYGGLEFSAYAHSCVLVAAGQPQHYLLVHRRGAQLARARGAAEPLRHRGTEGLLPAAPGARGGEPVLCPHRPARGLRCRLGSRTPASCAAAPGRDVRWLGLRLNFSKRYITLAPVATVIGLAFRLFDPDKLIGEKADIGITVALVPRNTPGITIGRRHFPLNIPFQNGPIQGKDVFVPLDFIVGGAKLAGAGWRMLVEQLSVGRCISLPSSATGGAKAGVWATGAYARIRSQLNTPVAKFEGVESVLARMVGLTYTMDAARSVTAGAIDGGESPRCLPRCSSTT